MKSIVSRKSADESGKGRNSLALRHMCRGDGKIYAVIEPSFDAADLELVARSMTLSGDELPAKVLDWRQGDCRVLTLPIVGVTQKCIVEAVDGNGEVVVRQQHMIGRHAARARSVANTFRKDEVVRQIRDCDDRRASDWCEVRIERVICGGAQGGYVLHGCVMVLGESREAVEGDIDLRILGHDGKDAAASQWICLRDVTDGYPGYEDAVAREMQFSVRLGQRVEAVTVWAISRSAAGGQGFRTLDPKEFSAAIEAWRGMTTTALDCWGYDRWYRTSHAVGAKEVALQAATRFDIEPLFSIIVPLYRTPPTFLREMVESVLRQSYANFELILVNGSPEDEGLSALVAEYAAADGRVVGIDLDENRGITENTNAGIAVAKGDFLCFLDHDDVITDDALFCYARAINKYPDTDLLYSDEDHIDAAGQEYFGPYFKPDWEPDLMLGMNYVCHFLCVRKAIVDECERPTSVYDGAQDHHMTLMVSEHARNIYHERRILYHWRVHEGSTANNEAAKPYALEARHRAVQSHLDRCGIRGKVVDSVRDPGRCEVVYELREAPLVSIIIPTKDNVAMLDRCLRSIIDKSTYGNYEIVLVENCSTEQATFEYYDRISGEDGRVRVVRFEGAFNYSAVNNFGVRYATGDYLVLLNNDTEVITRDWIERMLALCMREGTGVVGAKLLYPDGTIQHCGVMSTPNGPSHMNLYRDAGDGGYADNTFMCQDVAAVTGACLMTSRELYERLGGLDERLAVAYNDIDYCYAAHEEGQLVVLDPGVELYHYESMSRGFEVGAEKRLRFTRERALLMEKWPQRFTLPDPSSNPNLFQFNGYSQPVFK